MQGYVQKYGLWFPEDTPDALIELKCWKHWREPEYQSDQLRDPWDCFWRGIYQLLPRDAFVRHRWAEEHVFDWTTEDFVITWGCASSGKSNDYGLIALTDWMVDPDETIVILASTTLKMLKIRSYESVIRYFKLFQKHAPFTMPGKIRKTDSAIVLDDSENDIATDKASIRGVAVSEGTEEEARSNLQGAHLPYVRLVLDELSQMRAAAMSVRTNLAIGAKNFKLVGLCNIDSFTDTAGRHSIPLAPGGFKSVSPDVDEVWRSQYGKVRRHDGLKSPAIMEPNRADLGFLLNKTVLDTLVQQEGGNMDAPQIWTMIRAWPPAQGKAQTLISMAEIIAYNAMSPVIWRDHPALTVLGVDPAFSEAGNRGVMQPVELGYDVNGRMILNFPPARYIAVNASSKDPVLAQVGAQIAQFAVDTLNPLLSIDVRSDELSRLGPMIGVDDSATQSVADFMMIQYGMQVRRFSGNKAASELKLSALDPLMAKDRIYNQGTELWAALAAFIRAGQVRGLPSKVADQLTSRPTDPDKRPLRLVSKKANVSDGGSGGESPDDMDAAGFGVGVLRFFLNIIAGLQNIPLKYLEGSTTGPQYSSVDLRKTAVAYDLDSAAYMHEN